MKQCSKCNKELPLSEFNKKGTGKQPWCKECNRLRSRQYYAENHDKHREVVRENNKKARARNKEFLGQYKDVPCMDCGVKYPPYVMDFDHVKGEKIDNISNMSRDGTGLVKIMQEIKKCDIVCANCHRIRTHSAKA